VSEVTPIDLDKFCGPLSIIIRRLDRGQDLAGLVIAGAVTNSNTIEAFGTNATVTIDNTISNAASGTIPASGSGAQVQLDNATILGGKLQTSGSKAVIDALGGITDVFSGGTVTSGSLVEINDGSTLSLSQRIEDIP